MSTEASNLKWTSLVKCPVHPDVDSSNSWLMTMPLVLNNNELLIIPFTNRAHSLYKYNINDNKWIKWIKYPNDLDSTVHTASLNKDKTILYVFNMYGNVIQINLKTQQFIKSTKQFYNAAFASSLFIDGEFHVFGGCGDPKSHHVWSQKDETLKKMNDEDITKNVFILHSTVYVSSKKSVLITPNYDDSIYLYSLITNKCEQLTLNGFKKCRCPSTVITKYEQFIIIFGANQSNDIQILDLKSMKIRISNIHCPHDESVYAVMVSDDILDEILVFGFIRKCWNNPQYDAIQHLPIYLIQLIGKWYCHEMIHILNQRNNKDGSQSHWKVNVDDILKT